MWEWTCLVKWRLDECFSKRLTNFWGGGFSCCKWVLVEEERSLMENQNGELGFVFVFVFVLGAKLRRNLDLFPNLNPKNIFQHSA